jgi:iron complex transport system substrate-binding protein
MSLRSPSPARRLAIAAIGTAFAVTAAACSTGAATDAPESAGAVTVHNCDRDVTVNEPPQRIISLTQQTTELLLALGLADRMVGTAWWNEPVREDLADAEATVPRLSDRLPALEAVLEAEPDFVVAGFDSMYTDERVATRDRFAELGVATWLSPAYCHGEQTALDSPFELDDLYTEITDLAAIFGVAERGAELIDELRAQVADAQERVAGLELPEDYSVVFWYGTNDAPYMAGGTSAPALIARTLGVVNVYDDNDAMWPQVNWEDVLERDPDLFVMADLTREGEGQSMAQKIDYITGDPAISQLPAVRAEAWMPMRGMDLDPTINTVQGIVKMADHLVESFGDRS